MKPRSDLVFPLLAIACVGSLVWQITDRQPPGARGPEALQPGTPTAAIAPAAAEPLTPAELDELDRLLRTELAMWQRKLDGFEPVDPADPDTLVAEAMALVAHERAAAARLALAAGRWRLGDPGPMNTMTGRTWWTQLARPDGPVGVTIDLPYAEYPGLRDAQDYQLAVQDTALELRRDAFNRRTDAERFAIRDRLLAINASERPTAEQRDFRHRHLPPGLLMLQDSALLVRADQRR